MRMRDERRGPKLERNEENIWYSPTGARTSDLLCAKSSGHPRLASFVQYITSSKMIRACAGRLFCWTVVRFGRVRVN